MMYFKQFCYKELSKSKLLIIGSCILGTLLLTLIVKYFVSDDLQKLDSPKLSHEITIATDLVSTEDLWRAQIQESFKKQSEVMDEKFGEIKNDLSAIASDNERLLNIRGLEEKIKILNQQTQDFMHSANEQNLKISENTAESGPRISQYVGHLEQKINEEKVKTVDNYIPAGSMTKAVLWSCGFYISWLCI